MNRIDLPDPIARKRPLAFERFRYEILYKRYLPIMGCSNSRSFFSVIETRKTKRRFGPLSEGTLSKILWYTAKVHETFILPNRLPAQHRCVPSAGGIHPIDILLIDRTKKRVLVYDPIGHALCAVANVTPSIVGRLCRRIKDLVVPQESQIVIFAAEFNRTLSRYVNGEGLVWRDVGALIASFCFVSEALNLNCCPLGMTGEPFVSQLLSSSNQVVGVGGCLVGSRK
jgi:SagB-type dehydrogenase family enzyme